MNRRDFISQSAATIGALTMARTTGWSLPVQQANKLPQWRGFNVLDFFVPDPAAARPSTKEDYFAWMQDWGFDFIRVPIAYPYYLDIDHKKHIKPDEVYKISAKQVERIDALVETAHRYNMHVSLNLHRAPGYCINAGFYEPFNLWKDAAAQEAFNFHWAMWAKRYKGISPHKLSFDLLNEPAMREDMNDQHSKSGAVPGDVYRKVAKGALDVIHKENAGRIVIADGNQVGNNVIPELADLPIAQSCRGYFPGIISHYKAPWANKDPEHLPEPKWPGQVGDKFLSRPMLEEYYAPWIELKNNGVGVHCGECGCWNKTPHHVFLSWFGDVLSILNQHKIGFALWEFVGDFGVLDSNRADVVYEDWYGHKLDRKLLNLLTKR